jgi:hypothetical protein
MKNNGHKKQSKVIPNVSIIHHRSSPNSAVTADGKEVRREDKIWYAEYDDEVILLLEDLSCALLMITILCTKTPCGKLSLEDGRICVRVDRQP